MEPRLTFELTIDETNNVLTGLKYYENDIANLSQKIQAVAQEQINVLNKELEEKQKEESKSKKEGEQKN